MFKPGIFTTDAQYNTQYNTFLMIPFTNTAVLFKWGMIRGSVSRFIQPPATCRIILHQHPLTSKSITIPENSPHTERCWRLRYSPHHCRSTHTGDSIRETALVGVSSIFFFLLLYYHSSLYLFIFTLCLFFCRQIGTGRGVSRINANTCACCWKFFTSYLKNILIIFLSFFC